MRWSKWAIAAGVLIAFLVVPSVMGFLIEVAIVALIVVCLVLAIKAAFYRKQVSRNRALQRDPRAHIQRPAAWSQHAGCR